MTANSVPQSVGTTQVKLPSPTKLLAWTLSFYGAHWTTIVGIAVAPMLFALLTVVLWESTPLGLLVLINMLTSIAASFAYIGLMVMVAEGGALDAGIGGAYMKGMRQWPSFALIGLLTGLAVLGGTFLFIFPGVVAALSLLFAGFVLLTEHHRGMAALTRSWHYVRGYAGSVFWRLLVWSLLSLLAGLVVTFATSWMDIAAFVRAKDAVKPTISAPAQVVQLLWQYLVMTPLTIIYFYSIFSALKQVKTSEPTPAENQKIRRTILVFITVGVIGLVLLLLVALPPVLRNFQNNLQN
ncbi:MAG: Uncharacterized protein G01um101431_562 [Parcubacteria group bacterium Gr01-1014_31]|nr:MAG: Uncharacterized protein G01um101431_562 [Parcubacteria group bacterium Gr01-1014_31]